VRWPWQRVTRTQTEQQRAEITVMAARSHIRTLVIELESTLDRIGDKAEKLAHDR
jgi:predicted kinase